MPCFRSILGATPSWRTWIDEFGSATGPRYVFGRNEWGLSIANNWRVDAFVDDFTQEPTYGGLPVIRTADIEPDAMVASCVLVGGPLHVRDMLSSLGISNLDYYSLLRLSERPVKHIPFWEGMVSDLGLRSARYLNLRARLTDDLSRETLDRILRFRETLNLDEMVVFTNRERDQYFEDYLDLPAGSVFADVGGFDGYTSSEFARIVPDHGGIHFFEPIPANMAVARAKLSQIANVAFHDAFLGAGAGEITLSAAGSSSRPSESGEIRCQVVPLDSLALRKLTLLKIDVEGGEMDVMKGATRTIRELRPTVAVAVYHYPDEIWEVADFLLGIHDDYRVFLRHYTEGFAETVMTFVP